MVAHVILDDYVNQVTYQGAVVLEEHLQILLRPRPRWLPYRVWSFLVRRLIVIQTERL